MDPRISNLIQKAKRIIGFPFKAGRQQTTLLNSSSGRPGSHASDEKLVTFSAQPRPSEPSAGKSKSTLEYERPVGPQPSTHHPSEPPQSVDAAKENLRDCVQFNDSPSRMIVHHDGSAAYHALLLGKNLVVKQSDIQGYCRTRNSLNRKLEAIDTKVETIERNIYCAKELIKETSNDRKSNALAKALELEQQKLSSICQKRDNLEENLDILEMNLAFVKNESQGIIENALREANMLLPEPDDDSISSIQDPTEHEQVSTALSVRSSSTDISMEHTFRLALVDEMEEKRERFHMMKDAFDRRGLDAENDRVEYEQACQDGACDLPHSEFDRLALKILRDRTRDYIYAEWAYDEVKARARALGLLDDNEFEQESNFIDHPNDGYRESHDAAMTATIDVDSIEEWKAQIITSQDTQTFDENLEADDWEAKPIGFSDSISLVDYSRNRGRIVRWQEFCRLTRKGLADFTRKGEGILR
ncbi:hypothetical protein MMC07_002394 [Pseudocyphellaria aurata]|nr:hypothetical protein [Pseudocyphellaria aurata]